MKNLENIKTNIIFKINNNASMKIDGNTLQSILTDIIDNTIGGGIKKTVY